MKNLNISRNWGILVMLTVMVGTLRFLVADDDCGISSWGCAEAKVTIIFGPSAYSGTCGGTGSTNGPPAIMRTHCASYSGGAGALAATVTRIMDETGECSWSNSVVKGSVSIDLGNTGCELVRVDNNCGGCNFTVSNPQRNGKIVITASVAGDCLNQIGDICDWTKSEATFTATATITVDLPAEEQERGPCGAKCGSNERLLGTSSVFNDGVNLRLYLGRATPFLDAGYLAIVTNTPSADLAKPVSLQTPFLYPGVQVTNWTDGTIKQIKSPQGLIHVAVKDQYEYHLQCFYESSVVKDQYGEYVLDGNGFYTTNSSAFNTWIVKNPDGGSANNRLWITDYGSSRDFKYTFTAQGSRWDLVLPDGVTTNSTWKVRYDDYVTNYFYQVISAGTILRKNQKTYTWVSALSDKVLTQEVEGDGAVTQTTTYTYYSGGAGAGSANKLQRVDYPDGNWVYYKYDQLGRCTNEFSAYGNNAPPSPGSEPNPSSQVFKLVDYAYTLSSGVDGIDDLGTNNPSQPRRTITKIVSGGALREVSRTYRYFLTPAIEETREYPTPGLQWNGTGYLRTITERDTDGRPYLIDHPNGTRTTYAYPDDYTTIETKPDGRQTTTVVDEFGNILSRTTVDTTYYVTLVQETYTYTNLSGYFDQLRRGYDMVNLSGRTNSQRYSDCCGLDYTVNADGQTNKFDYDVLKRQVASTLYYGGSTGIKTTNVFDGAGRVLATKRIGTDSTTITLEQSLYDVLGRIGRQTNALGGVTVITNRIVSSRLCVTNTYPDGGTRVETYNRDGRLESVTGTAVNPVRYEYGIEDVDSGAGELWREYTKEIKLDASGGDTSEWIKTYQDGAGRSYKSVYPDGAYTESLYNLKGQLTKVRDADGVVTLYQYNVTSGELEYTATDLNPSDTSVDGDGNYGIDTSADRITQTVRTVVGATGGKPDLVRVETFVWDDGQSSGTLASSSETATSGLKSWRLVPGQDQAAVTETIYATSGSRATISTLPDGSQTVQTNSYGRLVAVARKNSSGGQLQRTDYQYDNHGRQYRALDARNGITQFAFNNADQVTSVTTPSPGEFLPGQTTVTAYDNMGRTASVTQPDATSVTNEYFATGLLKWTYGSRTYPVQYGHDAQGRMTSMKTYTNFSGNPNSPGNAATTTWNYDSQRGWLVKKVYDGETDSTADYTYTGGGRLKTRVWERGITTTYYYGFDESTYSNDQHGDLVKVDYSDSTPDATQAYDRRGRLKTAARNSITTTRTYNNANLMLTESYSGGSLTNLSVEHTYFASSDTHSLKLKEVLAKKDSTEQVKAYYSYDTGGRMSQARDNLATSYTADYGYVTDSPLVGTVTFKESTTTRLTTTKSYDFLNRLRSVSSVASGETLPLSFAYGYNNANQRIRMTLNDGSYWVYEYDALGQVKSGKRYWPSGVPVPGQQFEYSHDTIGNRTGTAVGGDENGANLRTASYSANSKNQYTSRGLPPYIEVLGIAKLDATVTVEGSSSGVYRRGEYFRKELYVNNTSAAQYPTIDVDTDVTSPVSGEKFLPLHPESFSHDTDGNLTQDGRWDYVWDGENRLLKLRSRSGSPATERRVEFEYDWQGRRIRQTVWNDRDDGQGSEVSDTLYLYDGWNLIAELNANSSNAKVRTYIWGLDLSGSMQGAGGVGGLLMVIDHTGSTKRHYAAYDGNGNVTGLADSTTGKWSARYEYGPFGEPIRANGDLASANPMRWSTKYTDGESGLVYYGYRSYNPSTGRWPNRDPIEERGGENIYCFVRNHPIVNWDYLGMGANLAPFNGHVVNRSKATLTISGDWLEIEQYYHFVIGDATPENRHETMVHYPWSVWADFNVRMQGYIKEWREPSGTHLLAPGHTMKGDWASGATRIVDSDFIVASTLPFYRATTRWTGTSYEVRCCVIEEPLPFRLKGGSKITVYDCPNGAGVYWQ